SLKICPEPTWSAQVRDQGGVTLQTQYRPRGHGSSNEVASMALALNIGKCTLLGNYRENNEDAIDVKQFPDLTICIVADGMGGQQAGEIASKQAIDVIPRELRKSLNASSGGDAVKTNIKHAIVQANEEIMA